MNSDPLLREDDLEIVANLPIPPGNLAVSESGRIFFNFHPEFNPSPTKVAELIKGTDSWIPFPNAEFQSKIITVLSLRIHNDILWLLDFAQHGLLGKPKLYGFLLSTDELIVEHIFARHIAGTGSMLNDFQIDPSGKYIYIADTSIVGYTPAIVIYSIEKDRSYRILSSHPSLLGNSIFFNVSGTVVKFGPFGLKVHVDSIALSRDGKSLYYGAVTSPNLYLIPTKSLIKIMEQEDTFISINIKNDNINLIQRLTKEISNEIRLVSSEKPVTDGLSTDNLGNIWLTAFEHSSIVIARPLKTDDNSFSGRNEEIFEMIKVVQSTRLLRWPDGLCFGSDGLYITNSALHLKFSGKTKEEINTTGPFHILRLPKRLLVQKNIIYNEDGWPTSGQ